jgi:c(7)-type cytochrome triheme protein
MCSRSLQTGLLAAAWGVLITVGLAAQSLPQLPFDMTLPQGADSPGKVVFSHRSHVDSSRPDCTTCHPKAFTILRREISTGAVRITHAKMEKGGQCGICHNGKAAHGLEDCTTCHR